MGALIDASILIDTERGRLGLAARVAELPEEEACLSVITASELLHGVHRAAQTEQRTRRAAFVEALLQRLPVLDVALPTARTPAPSQISRRPADASAPTDCGWPRPASPTASRCHGRRRVRRSPRDRANLSPRSRGPRNRVAGRGVEAQVPAAGAGAVAEVDAERERHEAKQAALRAGDDAERPGRGRLA